MNLKQFDQVCDIARRCDISFDEAAERFMLYGTGEDADRKKAREDWNAEVEAKKNERKHANKLRK